MPFIPDKPASRFTPDAAPPSDQTAGWATYTPSGEQKDGIASVTPAEAVMGHPVTQFAVGAAEPILGIMQAFGVPIDAKAIQDMSDRGAQLYGGNWTRVPARFAGNVLSPAFLAVAKMLPASATLGDLVEAGALMGGIGGATAVLPDGQDLEQRAVNAGIGMAAGTVIPLATASITATGKAINHGADLFRGEQGASNILDRYLGRSIGPANVPAVAQQLRAGGVEPLPGYKPTAAEAVAGLPEGSPLLAHQRITAATPGGPSADFGRRVLNQKAAIQAAETARDAIMVPQLIQSLARTNRNGIETKPIISGINTTLRTPGIGASDVVSTSLAAVKKKIKTLSTHGILNGEDLWTVRKEIGNTIKTASKETANWDKRLTGRLERQIQIAIDDAIVEAGGTDWPRLMAEYAARSQAIRGVKDTAKAALRPAQRTDLLGGLRIAEETRTHAPQLLSRPMMLANAILRAFSANIEPTIDRVAAQRYLNPIQYADALDKLPVAARSRVVETLMKMGIAPAVQQAITQQRADEQAAASTAEPAPEAPEAPLPPQRPRPAPAPLPAGIRG